MLSPPIGDQVTKCMSPWETVSFKPPPPLGELLVWEYFNKATRSLDGLSLCGNTNFHSERRGDKHPGTERLDHAGSAHITL